MNSGSRISVKQHNRKIILDLFRKSGTLSVSDLTDQTRISKPTVQKVIDFFEGKGILIFEGKGDSTSDGGKKPNLYRFSPDFGCIISLHVGPDFIYAAIADMRADIIHSHHFDIGKMDVDKVLDELGRIVHEFQRHEAIVNGSLVSIAIALPGIVDPKKGILVFTPHYANWGNDIRFADELHNRIDVDVPVFMDCTNRFQAVAEKHKGVARGCDNFITLDAMGEGVGSGVIVNGTVRHGSQNFSGEVGHMILDPHNGAECICGGKGCFEAMVSLKRIKTLVSDGEQRFPDSLIFSKQDPEQDVLNRIFTAAHKQDALALEIFNDICQWFAVGINNIIMVNDPELIVLQGIFNTGGDFFLNCLRGKINSISFPNINRKVQITLSEFGLERGVLGGACYGKQRFFDNPAVYYD
ncbi:MAG: ROK family transcriptional regulator [Bacteroidetes bacterium]|nr:ROK family transcriptional regulator [Bacteroidota bacterium]